MTLLSALLLATQLLAPASAAVHTGFNVGAFWGTPSNCKTKADYLDAFNYAKKLPTPVPFDTARLFTTIQCGTNDLPNEALDAAVETNTKVLLGFYLTAPKDGKAPTNADLVKNELAALKKAFEKHDQKLADLVIGLSVGNEDIFNWYDTSRTPPAGADEGMAQKNFDDVRAALAQPPFADFMKGKPLGHTETVQYAGKVQGVDFAGMNAYPYWHGDTIDNANASYHSSLADTEKALGKTPIWLTEVGWPHADTVTKFASSGQANAQNLQRYWTEVGCSLIGKYNTFWFELFKDTENNQPDWALVDPVTKQLRIKDLTCPGMSAPENSATPAPSSSETPSSTLAPSQGPSTLITVPISSTPAQPSPPPAPPSSQSPSPAPTPSASTSAKAPLPPSVSWLTGLPTPRGPESSPSAPSTVQGTAVPTPPSAPDAETVVVTTTVVVTLPSAAPTAGNANTNANTSAAAPAAGNAKASASGIAYVTEVTGCITAANVNGKYVSVASNSPGPGGVCPTPPPYPGSAYGKPSTPPTAPAAASNPPKPAPAAPTSSAAAKPSPSTPAQPAKPSAPASSSAAASAPSKPSPSACKRRVRPERRY